MQRPVSISATKRRLVTVVAIGALLAALVLIQGPALLGLAASTKPRTTLPILTRCDSANVSTTQSQPSHPGQEVAITATSTACDLPEYRYLLLAPGTTTWAFMTAYTASTSYVWKTDGAPVGVWQIGVWAREGGTTSSYDAYAIGTFIVNVRYCSGALISTELPSPQAAGTSVRIWATGVDCPAPAFEFWKMLPGTSTWVLAIPWGVITNPWSFVWNTTGLTPGLYRWAVWAREAWSTQKYDSYAMLAFYVI